MQTNQTAGEPGATGSDGRDAVMMQGGHETDAGGQDTWPQTMEQRFTYTLNPSLQFEITVSVKPVMPPTAALVGSPGPRPK